MYANLPGREGGPYRQLASRDTSISADGLDTPLEVDTKIANALLGLATEAFVAAQRASRDASITALQGAKADATLLASYATNAARSVSETTLQSALDAILAELAALQLSGSGGVVNAPAWAGFTTWELVRGSNVVRNLQLEAPLSAALTNGDDTLSMTADCYSIAAADAALAAALLTYYTSSQVDALSADYRTGAAQDAETTSTVLAALLAYYTSAQVDALLGDYRTASAQDTQTQAAIAGALLAYRTGPDQDVFTTNQITSARTVRPQTRTQQRPRASQPRCSAVCSGDMDAHNCLAWAKPALYPFCFKSGDSRNSRMHHWSRRADRSRCDNAATKPSAPEGHVQGGALLAQSMRRLRWGGAPATSKAWIGNGRSVASSNKTSSRKAPSTSNIKVKACCTAPSLNPNMNPQKNKASLKRPQFFLPGLLRVALLPGHWCAWNRPRETKTGKTMRVLASECSACRAWHACPRPRSGD